MSTDDYTSDVIRFLLCKDYGDVDRLREVVREKSASLPSREYAAVFMKAAMFSALDPFVSEVPRIVADLLARTLNKEVDWEAVVDSICTDPAMN
jgi:hypothetical protein